MKFVKILLGLVAAGTLLVGGFAAGSFITQSRSTNAQPVFVQQQPFQPQPTAIQPQQVQPTIIPQQIQPTIVPQQPAPTIPPQGQWGPGWWMHDWEDGWGWNQPVPNNQGYQQQWGPGMMHDWNDNCCGGYGQQTNPNWNITPSAPNRSPSYPTPSTPVSFKQDVQPIFAARCVACHGGTNGLYLDTYENVMKGGINGAVVTPGDVYNSRLAYYVYSGYMPFRSGPLTPAEIQTILDWIAAGAQNN